MVMIYLGLVDGGIDLVSLGQLVTHCPLIFRSDLLFDLVERQALQPHGGFTKNVSFFLHLSEITIIISIVLLRSSIKNRCAY